MYKYIVTHGGRFHADDVFAVATLRLLLGAAIPVFRRDPTPEEMDDSQVIVLDVGGRFDVATSCYDHHQRGFELERDPDEGYGIAGEANNLAAFGLIWLEFPLHALDERVHQRVDAALVRGVDLLDANPAAARRGTGASLSRAIYWLNPQDGQPEDYDAAFEVAVKFATNVIGGATAEAEAFIKAEDIVRQARAEVSGTTLVLDKYVPWQEHIFGRGDQSQLLYVVHPSDRGGYILQQVPKEPNGFEGRKPLPEEWAGLRGADIQRVTGVSDAMFTHVGRFVGGAASLDGTLAMAKLAVAHA